MTTASALNAAFGRVGATTTEVFGVLGDLAAGGDPYLVGSLAAGLGNVGSDIDIQVLCSDPPAGDVPAVFFLRRTILEVQFLSSDAPRILVGTLNGGLITTPYGPCLLGAAPSNRNQKRLSRWLTAIPLTDGGLLLDDGQAERARGALVRGALEQYLKAVWVAQRLERTATPMLRFAWRRAARWAVETWVRGRGDVFVGDKWMAAKALRSADRTLVRALGSDSLAAVAELAASLGLPDPAMRQVVRHDGARPDLQEVSLGDATWLVGDNAVLELRDTLNLADPDVALYVSLALCTKPGVVDVDPLVLDALVSDAAVGR